MAPSRWVECVGHHNDDQHDCIYNARMQRPKKSVSKETSKKPLTRLQTFAKKHDLKIIITSEVDVPTGKRYYNKHIYFAPPADSDVAAIICDPLDDFTTKYLSGSTAALILLCYKVDTFCLIDLAGHIGA